MPSNPASSIRLTSLGVAAALSLALTLSNVLMAQDSTNVEIEKNSPLSKGEMLFRAMENKILKAKTVQATFMGQQETAGEVQTEWKGTFVSGGKNRLRISFSGEMMGPPGEFLLISDGEDFRLSNLAKPNLARGSSKCPDKMSENLLHSLTRYITFPMRLTFPLTPRGEERIAKEYGISDFKFIRTEKIDGQDANIITHKMQFSDHRRFLTTVWIDAASQLPVKRVIDNGEGQQELLVEFFKDWKLGEKVNENLFTLEE